MQEKKLGIKETMDVLNFTDATLDDLVKHASDDGKLDGFEIGQTAVENAPGAWAAFRGADMIDDELKDLDQDEVKQLAAKGLAQTQKVWQLVQALSKKSA